MTGFLNNRKIYIRHKVNEGARIYTPQGSIDVLVREISGTGRKRNGKLDIITVNDRRGNYPITYEQENLELIDDVFFYIKKNSKTTGNQLGLEYVLPNKDYLIDVIVEIDNEIKLKFPEKSIWLKRQETNIQDL